MNFSLFKKQRIGQRIVRLLLLIVILLSLGLGLLVVPFEKSSGNIKTAFDGIWWAVSTITTVGYGDLVPVTVTGKIIGIVLQLVGVVFYGSLVATVSILLNRKQDEFYWSRVFERLDRLEEKLDKLGKSADYMVKRDEE